MLQRLIWAGSNLKCFWPVNMSQQSETSCRLLDLEPLKHNITEHMMAKDTLALILAFE